jgi:hypothetical protein
MLGPLSESMNEYFSSLDDNPLGRGLLWNTVLNLNEKDQKNIEILRAFETAGLDHRNPFHWRKLLECFAKAHFGKKKTKPKKWDAFEFCVLLKDYLDVTRNHPELKASEACKLLMKDKAYRDKYGHYNFHALRKLLRQASSPKHNMYLRHPEMRNPILQEIRDECERRDIPWDESFGKQIAEAVKLCMEAEIKQSKI